MRHRYVVYLLPVLLFSMSVGAEIPSPESVLSTLKKNHPRLHLTVEGFEKIINARKTDPALDKCIDDIILRAEAGLAKPPLEHKLIGPRLLSVSRECLARTLDLGLAFRITGDEKYARACESNLLTVCAFPDWNPSHFLDVAEMTNAVGIGYDWLYSWLSPVSRETIRAGLVKHGLEPGVQAYRGENNIPRFWVDAEHNWNQVCNGGLVNGALAIAETNPEFARAIIPAAVVSYRHALETYNPDGAWPEGPGYWHYASRYTAYGLSAMQTALGTDFGLSDIAGMMVTGNFPIYTAGPTELFVNFADSGERARRVLMPCLFWFARRYNLPFVADDEHRLLVKGTASPEHVMWYVSPAKGKYSPDLDRLFRGPVEVAVLRSAWNDPDALFVGFKAGYNQVNHAHLDLGNFEMDALGVRWARDLGSDDYNLPGYWGMDKNAVRWTYYRLNSFSHNVCTLNGENQDVEGESHFVSFHSGKDEAYGVVDLTTAYAPVSKKTLRGVRLVGGRKAVLVADEFDMAASTDIAWGMTTDATISVEGAEATLTQDGKTLVARILSPPDARFAIESAEQQPPQKPNEGVKRLVVRLTAPQGTLRIAVLLSPRWNDGTCVDKANVIPLEEWKNATNR